MTYELIALDEHGREQGCHRIATLPFKPGDVLIVQVPHASSMAEIERLRAKLDTIFPPERVLIVREGVRFLRLEAMDG